MGWIATDADTGVAGGETDRPGTHATVLFVDDEPWVVAGLGRVLHMARPGWQAIFAGSGEEALALLADRPVDVIVTDLRMPEMDGVQLLAAVQAHHPGVCRLVLSGYADRDMVIAGVGPAQQFLAKPIDTDVLVAAVDRVLRLRDLVADHRLRDLLGGMSGIPELPETCRRIAQVTANPNYDLNEVVDVICNDLAVSAQVLRLVNSSFFGIPTAVESIHQAVTLLGLPVVQALAAAGAAFAAGPTPPPGLDQASLSRQGLAAATITRQVARAEGWPAAAVADIFQAGLLSRVALPALACAQPQGWEGARPEWTDAVRGDPREEDALCTRHFGCPLSQASAFLLGLWGFAEPVVHAVADHPAQGHASPAAHLLTYAIYAANNLPVPGPPPGDGYLTAARLDAWRALAPIGQP